MSRVRGVGQEAVEAVGDVDARPASLESSSASSAGEPQRHRARARAPGSRSARGRRRRSPCPSRSANALRARRAHGQASLRGCRRHQRPRGRFERSVVAHVGGVPRIDADHAVRSAPRAPGRGRPRSVGHRRLHHVIPPRIEARGADDEVERLAPRCPRSPPRRAARRRPPASPARTARARRAPARAPVPRAISASRRTFIHGLRSRSSHTASATRPPGLSTRRVSRSAASGSSSSM